MFVISKDIRSEQVFFFCRQISKI